MAPWGSEEPKLELDRQTIEKRDFPITRRGYDPAAVDSHLASVAQELERKPADTAGPRGSVADVASGMIHTILEAAENTATDIERSAKEDAARLQRDASHAAQSMRDEAIAKSRSHLSAISSATEPMLERIGTIEREFNTLAGDFRAGAQRLISELAGLVDKMPTLYETAAAAATEGKQKSQQQADANAFAAQPKAGTPGQPTTPGPAQPAPAAPAQPKAATPGQPTPAAPTQSNATPPAATGQPAPASPPSNDRAPRPAPVSNQP
jgi:DivIVA domain-containing protein